MLSYLKKRIKAFATRNELLIFNYHGVISDNFPYSLPYHMPVATFREQMKYLSAKYNCISLPQMISDMKSGKTSSNSIAITFDDGYFNNYSNAFPILEEYNIPATIFVAVGFTGKQSLIWPDVAAQLFALTKKEKICIGNQIYPLNYADEKATAYKALTQSFKSLTQIQIDETLIQLAQEHSIEEKEIYQSNFYNEFRLLDWPEICELAKSDLITLGSHTINHRRLSKLTLNEARLEIQNSKNILEEHLGEIELFAYPYGGYEIDYTDEHINLVKESGYCAAFTSKSAAVNSNSRLKVYEIPRVNITSAATIKYLDHLLTGGSSFPNGFTLPALSKGIISGTTNLTA